MRGYANPARIHECKVVKGQNGIACQMGVVPDTQHGLHELLPAGMGHILEAVETVSQMLEAAAMSELPQLDSWHIQLVGVTRRDVAILVQGALAQ